MLSTKASYFPLWCKSNYSFLEGASFPKDLVETVQALGLPGLAITDRDGVYGIVQAHVAAKAAGIKLIIGSQVTVDDGSAMLLLSQNREGYANLCGLLSQGHLRNPKGHPAVSWPEIAAHSRDLVAIWLPNDAVDRPGRERLAAMREAFPDRFYAAVARHLAVADVRRERETRAIAQDLAIPLVAAPEFLYHQPDQQRLQDVLTCIKQGVKITEAGTRLRPNAEYALIDAAAFQRRYADAPELITATLDIAERCQFSLDQLEYRYPNETVPEGFTTMGWLREQTYRGARWRYQGEPPGLVREQIDKELLIIDQLQYAGYFLTMKEIVEYCKAQNILCQGRGSAANSAVCFCLGITAIDPATGNLLFERFLSLERAEPPDIDLDIEHDRREEVIQHMYNRYGRDRAAMVANVVRYRRRSALREVGRVFGISEVTLDRCAKLMAHWGGTMAELLQAGGLDPTLPINQHLVEMTEAIHKFPRHLSIHPGGFLLGSEAVHRIVPVENATMPDRTVIQWDKDDIETLNLFKVDLLGLGALSQLDYCFRLLKTHYGTELSIATIPPDDEATYAMMRRADTIGVFQIESRAQMSMLPRLKPEKYYDLVIEISLVRPGPISGGMVHPYLKRRSGEEPIVYPHPKLKSVLKKTCGVPLFQEQVMKLAMVVADYTAGEADQLRRDMAAWRHTGNIERHREKLITGMRNNNIDAEFAERIFKQIMGFGDYGFPESHAASFAIIAYATAYLKCHYHAVFTCALLNAWPMGFYSPATIVEDAKRHQVAILPIHALQSDWECTLERTAPEAPWAVRIGLRYLKSFSRGDWDVLRAGREARRPQSLAEFKAACRLPRDSFENLAESGALECFGVGRRTALWSVLEAGSSRLLSEASPQPALFAYQEGRPQFRRLDPVDEVLWDYETTSHGARHHLIEPFRDQLQAQGIPDAATVNTLGKDHQTTYAGYVICRQMPQTAKGVLFMTLEDETGYVNLVVWNRVFEKYRATILTNWLLGVTGTLQVEESVVHLVAESFWLPNIAAAPRDLRVSSHNFY